MEEDTDARDAESIPSNMLQPRSYQVELLKRAESENIVVFLETGAGKTLVAAHLICKVTGIALAGAPQGSTVQRLPEPAVESPRTAPGTPGGRAAPVHLTKGKLAVFLADKVPLVRQQASFLKRVVADQSLVGAYFGDQGIDDWSGSKWVQDLKTKRVLVMTAQIFLNLLRHGLVDMTNVAILVFDEVHHATKLHPFRRIMVEFFHTLAESVARPRIFGMTASPVKSKDATASEEDCRKAIAQLEITLNSTVVVVSDSSQEEVDGVVPRPNEFVVTYKCSAATDGFAPDEFALVTPEEEEMARSFHKVLASIESCTLRSMDSQPLTQGGASVSLQPSEQKIVGKVRAVLGVRAAAYLAQQFCVVNGSDGTTAMLNVISKASESERENGGISNKVSLLLDLLFAECQRARQHEGVIPDANSNAFRSIVFVEERICAVTLAWLINTVFGAIADQALKARVVVGVQNSSSHFRMTQAEQKEVLRDFRDGEFGILVATNVVEEGLDVPACRLVTVFDEVKSPASYVQGRGRARRKGARYVVFLPEGPRLPVTKLRDAKLGALMTRKVAGSEDTRESLTLKSDMLLEELKDFTEPTLESKTTRARVPASGTLYLLAQYCVCVLRGQSSSVLKAKQSTIEKNGPRYETKELMNGAGFTARVFLPRESPVLFGQSTSPAKSVNLAKRMASLDAYTKLYNAGEVDEFLFPKRRRAAGFEISGTQLESEKFSRARRTGKAKNSERKLRACRIAHPEPLRWIRPTAQMCKIEKHRDVYLYRLVIDRSPLAKAYSDSWVGHFSFGIIVQNMIPEDDLKAVESPRGEPILSLELIGQMPWSSERDALGRKYISDLQTCHRGRCPEPLGKELSTEQKTKTTENDTDSVNKDGNGNGYDATAPGFMMVPLCVEDDVDIDARSALSAEQRVDWKGMEKLVSFDFHACPTGGEPALKLEHSIVRSSHDKINRVYVTGSLRADLNASSSCESFLNRKFSTFLDYFSRQHSVKLSDPSQNMLESFVVHERIMGRGTGPFLLAPETCRRLPVSPWAVYVAALLPSWQTFLSLRASWRQLCGSEPDSNRSIERPPKGPLLEFLPFSQALLPHISDMQHQDVDLSYERLEFLGDAVLKVIFTMLVFCKSPHEREGKLSELRDSEVSNQRLGDVAVRLGIQNCVAFTGLSRKARRWPWFWAAPQRLTVNVSEKVLADCIEAAIGVHFVSGGVEMASQFMDRHGILRGSCDLLRPLAQNAMSVPVSTRTPTEPRVHSSQISDVEHILRYEFENKRYLVEALTHGSFARQRKCSYQRYEFLGDAVIGFVLLSHFYEKYPALSPGELSTLREPAVSNDVFARVTVAHGLHEKFWHRSSSLATEIKKHVEQLKTEEKAHEAKKRLDGSKAEENTRSMVSSMPKVLGDILESVIGAVVVDQGMRLSGVREMVLRLMKRQLDQFANPETIDKHPVTLAAQAIQKAFNESPTFEYTDPAKRSRIMCRMLAGSLEISRGSGATRREAKLRAALSALKSFESSGNGKVGGGRSATEYMEI